jgi:LAO/AO transport system kinase
LVDWLDAALGGDRRAMARLMTLVEEDGDAAHAVAAQLYPHTGQAYVIGVTGAPGAGKSSLVNELGRAYRVAGRRVGIVAVDASSPFSGGAVLGDRVRMRDVAHDANVFVRSMASRGHMGGLARTTPGVVRVLDAAGYDTIIVETVGAGQLEVEIAQLADTVVVVDTPGTGDDIQSIKAGIVEIADVFAVNKADHDGADRTAAILEAMLALGSNGMRQRGRSASALTAACGWQEETTAPALSSTWRTPVVKTVAVRGVGTHDLVQAVAAHREYLQTTGEGQWRRRERLIAEVERELRHRLMQRLIAGLDQHCLADVLADVVARRIDPRSAAEQLHRAGGN